MGSDVFTEAFFGPDVARLKQYAFELKEQLKFAGFFKRIAIRKKLLQVLDEIEYQEGRKQFANRPYSFPTALRCAKDPMRCSCGCWVEVRDANF